MTTKYCTGIPEGIKLRMTGLHYLRKTEKVKPGILKSSPLTNDANGPSPMTPGLRGVHVFLPYVSKPWMVGTSPAMTS
jgi:hypothetical protein